jgi:hypothetical protein
MHIEIFNQAIVKSLIIATIIILVACSYIVFHLISIEIHIKHTNKLLKENNQLLKKSILKTKNK